ncbi:LolA family protein [Pleomorphovibrio marinus]|uniref:LolA family protein n=1 Tax=Pleomorphovibrio marinus TaxID=2164132 RepID=UPI000E0CAAD7|nr:outer membrane lipoprotein carrier protein LolA [Pleomorphovibrio marinus]
MLKSVVAGVLLMMGTNIEVVAQSAEKILEEVSERYQQLDGFKATFEYTYSTDTDGVIQANTGEVTVKGDKYRLVLDDQEIYNDGNTVWTYIKSSRYEEVTINSVEENSDELTPSNVYNIYKKGYESQVIGEENMEGKPVYEILLTSERKSSQFKEIRLFVEKATKDLVAWEIQDDAGGKFQYKFKEVQKNQSFQDDYFVFNTNEHKNIEIIDLR